MLAADDTFLGDHVHTWGNLFSMFHWWPCVVVLTFHAVFFVLDPSPLGTLEGLMIASSGCPGVGSSEGDQQTRNRRKQNASPSASFRRRNEAPCLELVHVLGNPALDGRGGWASDSIGGGSATIFGAAF